MTLESSVSRETFVGNGATKVFDFTFKVWEADQILVYRILTNYSEEDCTSECDIEVNDDAAGGTVTFRTAPEDGVTIAIVRNMSFTQEDRYIDGTVFNPHVVETRFDKDCAERQQLLDGVTRAVKVPNTDSRTAEEYEADFWQAVQDTETNKEISESCANRSCSEADRSRDEADRAAEEVVKAGIVATLGGTAENLDATWALERDYAAGETVDLPVPYFPARSVLHVSYDGIEMYRGQQYEEVGDDPDTVSWSIQTLIDLDEGAPLHVWVVMSNLARYASTITEELREAETEMVDTKDACVDEMKESLSQFLDEAESCRDEACGCAGNAKTSQEIAENAAVEATEQADRADDAAADAQAASADAQTASTEAQTASTEAKEAAAFAHLNRQGRAVGAVREFASIEGVPSGFWVVNPNIVVPATIQHPVTPAQTFDGVPTDCDGFFVIGPEFERDYPCVNSDPDGGGSGGGGSGGGSGGGGDGGGTTTAKNTVMQPCGARQRYSTAY